MIVDIKKELESVQKQIENTDPHQYALKSYLLLRKIDLLKILEAQKQSELTIKKTYKEIIEQLEEDIRNNVL